MLYMEMLIALPLKLVTLSYIQTYTWIYIEYIHSLTFAAVANCTMTDTNHVRHSFVSNVTDVCIYMSTEFKSWDKSRGDCKSRGGDLVTITNKALHDEMKKMGQTLATSHGAQDDQYWVALTSGRWQQSDGTCACVM